MSEDYFYICRSKKIYMPAFSFQMQGLWHAHEDGILRFTSATHGESVELVHENLAPSFEHGWEYVNPYMDTADNG